MRDLKVLQKSLNQTQRIRLQSALQQLQEIYSRAPSSPAATAAVSVSDSIHVNLEDGVLKWFDVFIFLECQIVRVLFCIWYGFVRGHGTTNRNDDVVATVCGFVERVNKLVYVRDFRARCGVLDYYYYYYLLHLFFVLNQMRFFWHLDWCSCCFFVLPFYCWFSM